MNSKDSLSQLQRLYPAHPPHLHWHHAHVRAQERLASASLPDNTRHALESFIELYTAHTAAAAAAAATAGGGGADAGGDGAAADDDADADAPANTAAAEAAAAEARKFPTMPQPTTEPSHVNDASVVDHISIPTLVNYLYALRPRIKRRIQWRFVRPWQLVQKSITDDVHKALDSTTDVENDLAVNRSLKWWLISHALFFRHQGKSGRGRRRTKYPKDTVQNRFDWWNQGNMKKLVDLFVRDAESELRRYNRSSSTKDPTTERNRTIKRAMEFLELGLLSKCRSLLLSIGLGDMKDPAVVAQLDSKHPQRQRELPGFCPATNAGSITIDPDALRKKYQSLGRLAGVGPDGLPNEHLIALASATGDSEAHKAMAGHAYMAEQYFNGSLPRWWYAIDSAVRMIALIKARGKSDVRPVAIGNCRRRAWSSYLVKRVAPIAGDSMHIQQVAVGVSSGIPILFQAIRQHLELNSDHCVLKVDIRNAHNECSRAAMLNAFLSHSEAPIRQLAIPFWLTYSPSAEIFGITARSEDGGQQGDAFASLGFALGIHPALCAADEFLHTYGGKACAISDDMYFVGPKERILEIARITRDRLHEEFQCTLQPSKSEIWGRNTQEIQEFLSTCGEDFKIGSSNAGYGIMVGGLPVGDSTFINDKLSAKIVRILEDNKKISDYLRSYSSAGLFAVLWHCCQPLLQHEMQNLPPRLLHRHLKQFDDNLRLMVTEAAINIKDMDEDNLILRRMRLPIRLKGAGLRQMDGWLAHAAFIGGLLRTLPELSTRTIPGNRSREGMHNVLASQLLGDNSFDLNNERFRFRTLLEGDSTLAADFQTSWSHLQETSQADLNNPNENILSVPAMSAGCALEHAPAEGSPATAKLFPGMFQYIITAQVEAQASINLERDMAALPDTSRIKTAFYLSDEFSNAFIACPPKRDFHIRCSEYHDIWYTWAGLPNPHFSNFVGKPISSRRTRNGETFTRKVDPYGDNLCAVSGKHMLDKHDHIKWCWFDLMQYVNYGAECEPKGLFRQFAANLDESEGMRKREILQPDFLFDHASGTTIADIKTISFTTTNYGGRKRTTPHLAVNTRANRVHKEYVKKAQQADRKWNTTPSGSIGPIESRLNEFGTVTPFVFGFLGEASKAVHNTIKDMAAAGSEHLWRQMGQTSQANAYGILLRKLRRRLGVAATRANARMRLRVLGTLFGRRDDSQYNRTAREEARFREAEWDNYNRHGPRGHAEYHHGFEHCI